MMMDKYPLSWSELADAFAYCRNQAGWLMSRIDGSARLHIPFHYIAGAQTTGMQLHEQFTRANCGERQVNDTYIVIAMILDS
jgi:hypothetical protein